jgi:hypothetical protein
MTRLIGIGGIWLTGRASPCAKSMEVWVYPTSETSIYSFWDPGSGDISKMKGNYGKTLIDNKYNTNGPNIFCSSTDGISQFFKGVMWAAKAAKI